MPRTPKLLLDANLSPETAEALRKLGCDVKSIQEENLGKLSDEEVVRLAKKEKRIIITFDRDLAEIWYFKERGRVGILLLRTRFQTVEYINPILALFIESKTIQKDRLEKALVILSESGHRIVRY